MTTRHCGSGVRTWTTGARHRRTRVWMGTAIVRFMTPMDLNNLIQSLVVVTAVGASIVALIIASKDRENARKIAAEDRQTSIRQARLLFEWEAAKRLSIIEARGGHSDPVISKDMGAESLALIGLLGAERVPRMWARRVGKTDAELTAFVEDETNQQYLRDAVEAERAVQRIIDDLHALEKDAAPRRK